MLAALAGPRVTVVVELEPAREQDPEAGVLTPREREVVGLIAQGLPNKRIAAELQISPWTVSDHLKAIFAKTGVRSRSELMALVLGRRRAAA
jgi:DNA-binding CsgD family transcriptional regulator